MPRSLCSLSGLSCYRAFLASILKVQFEHLIKALNSLTKAAASAHQSDVCSPGSPPRCPSTSARFPRCTGQKALDIQLARRSEKMGCLVKKGKNDMHGLHDLLVTIIIVSQKHALKLHTRFLKLTSICPNKPQSRSACPLIETRLARSFSMIQVCVCSTPFPTL